MSHAQPAAQSEVVQRHGSVHEPVDGPVVLPLTHPRAPQNPQPACSVHDVHVAYAAHGSPAPQSGSQPQPVWQPAPVSQAQELLMHGARSAHAVAPSAHVRWSAVDAGQSVAHDDVSTPTQMAATWLQTVVQLAGVTPPPPRRPLLQEQTRSDSETSAGTTLRCMGPLSSTGARR